MPKIVEPAKESSEYYAILQQALESWHTDLVEAEVSFQIMLISSDKEEPCLRLHGYPAAAVVRINSPRRRAEGSRDVTIDIDVAAWNAMSREERVAVLDHEAEHIELVRDKDGNLKCDDRGRPKVKCKLHDLVVGAFASVIARHGRKSLDLQQVQVVNEALRQRHFEWSDDCVEPDPMPRTLKFGETAW